MSGLLMVSCGGGSVTPSPVTQEKIILTSSKYELVRGEMLKVNIKLINLESSEVSFSSSNEEVLKIDSDGNIQALKEGSATLKCSKIDNESVFASLDITVLSGDNDIDYNYYKFDSQEYRRHSLNSIGKQKVLVLPVQINDFESYATQKRLDDINELFNSDTNSVFESVKSYYKKSSYGKLDLEFVVPDKWYNSNLDPLEIAKRKVGDDCGTSWLIEDATNWYKKTYNSDLTEFDLDNDGFIDSIWGIYGAPNMNNYDYNLAYGKNFDTTLFWAFTTDSYLHNFGTKGAPTPKVYGWASYDFMNEFNIKDSIDAHTYIHETGHQLGLKDYYSYAANYGKNDLSNTPTGCIDMMDMNIGDHGAFSKYALGWANPIIIKEATTIELNSFTDTGDFIVLTNDNFNGTAFDEYFIVELVTPTGLNKRDAENIYPSNELRGYTQEGIKITHIDNRCVNNKANFETDYNNFFNDPISNTAIPGLTYFLDSNNDNPAYQQTLMQKNVETTKYNVLSGNRNYLKAIRNGNQNADDSLFYTNDEFNLKDNSPYLKLMPSSSNKLNKYYQSKNSEDSFNFNVKVIKIENGKCQIEISEI